MANKKIDLTGQRFGRLVALKDSGKRVDRKVIWECMCDCGKRTEVVSRDLRNGHTQSCGCLRNEKSLQRIASPKVKKKLKKHLKKDTREKGTRISLLDQKKRVDNTSGVKGVYWAKNVNMWNAKIGFKGKSINLGYFKDKQDAIHARKEAEEKYFEPILEKYESAEKK